MFLISSGVVVLVTVVFGRGGVVVVDQVVCAVRVGQLVGTARAPVSEALTYSTEDEKGVRAVTTTAAIRCAVVERVA